MGALATVVHVQNGFDPLNSRIQYDVDKPITIRHWLDAQGIHDFPRPTICVYNGKPLLRAGWGATLIAA